jgi:hypothetical protein
MALAPNAKLAFRKEIVAFCLAAEKAEARWHYSQRRPFSGFGDGPTAWHDDDCSAYVSLVFYAAGRNSKHPVADPLGPQGHYSGWGYTGTALAFLDTHHAPPEKYRVGDIAIYGTVSDTVHMVVCRKAGTSDSSIWSSHGNEGGPQPVKLHYHPSPLVGAFRHPALL